MCDFCCEDGKIIDCNVYDIFGNEMTASIMISTYKGNRIVTMLGDNEIAELRINYCPLCGRKLK